MTLGVPVHFCGEQNADWCLAGHRGVRRGVRAAVVVVKAQSTLGKCLFMKKCLFHAITAQN